MATAPEIWVIDDGSEAGSQQAFEQPTQAQREIEEQRAGHNVPQHARPVEALQTTGPGGIAQTAADPAGDDEIEVEEDEEDIIYPDEIKERLVDRLEEAHKAGTFAHLEFLKDPPNPGLFIDVVGMISLSLSEDDIERIIAASGQSRLEDTVDAVSGLPALRKVWEIPGHRWSTRNPSWTTRHNEILKS